MTDNTSKGKSQTALLREHLESGKPITMLQALRLFGIGNLKGRIYDIRKKGVDVRREWATFVARSGHVGHYAVYSVQKPGIVSLEKDGVTISPSALDAIFSFQVKIPEK